MAKSKGDRATCSCGLAHVLAVYNRASYDELELPLEIHSFASCDDWEAWVDALPPGYGEDRFAEVMSTHVSRFPKWLKRHEARYRDLSEIDPADPEVLRKLRGEDDSS